MHHRMPPSKPQFKRGDFSTWYAPRPARHKTVTIPEIIDQIHQIILEDRRISARSIAEQLGISRERVGAHHSWRFGHAEALREVGPEMSESGSKTSTVPVVWATFGIFSAWSKRFPVGRVWWPWTKPGYITMTRKQSNNQWSGGIAAHPSPKKSECKNPQEKFSSRFFEIRTASS